MKSSFEKFLQLKEEWICKIADFQDKFLDCLNILKCIIITWLTNHYNVP